MFIGVWLIVKGFNPPATAPEPDETDISERSEERGKVRLSKA